MVTQHRPQRRCRVFKPDEDEDDDDDDDDDCWLMIDDWWLMIDAGDDDDDDGDDDDDDADGGGGGDDDDTGSFLFFWFTGDTYNGMREGFEHCSVGSHEAYTSCKGVRIIANSYLPLGKINNIIPYIHWNWKESC